MKANVYELRNQYADLFGQVIPNEPTWPAVVMNNPDRFAELLERSVKEKRDYLTEAYGTGWNEEDEDKLY